MSMTYLDHMRKEEPSGVHVGKRVYLYHTQHRVSRSINDFSADSNARVVHDNTGFPDIGPNLCRDGREFPFIPNVGLVIAHIWA